MASNNNIKRVIVGDGAFFTAPAPQGDLREATAQVGITGSTAASCQPLDALGEGDEQWTEASADDYLEELKNCYPDRLVLE